MNQNWNYLYFQVSLSSNSICCCPSCRPFVVHTSSPGLVGCRRSRKNDEKPTGPNTTIWMGRRWNLKIKVIPILILTGIFPSLHETWYLKTFISENLNTFSSLHSQRHLQFISIVATDSLIGFNSVELLGPGAFWISIHFIPVPQSANNSVSLCQALRSLASLTSSKIMETFRKDKYESFPHC